MTNPVLAYLEAQFLAARQKAISVVASFDVDNDEIIYLDAVFPRTENVQETVRYRFEAGSDDDEYVFESTSHAFTTPVHIPIQPFEV